MVNEMNDVKYTFFPINSYFPYISLILNNFIGF